MAQRPRIISTLRARGAVLVPPMRYVLIISLALAVAALVFVYLQSPIGKGSKPTTVAGPL